MKRGRDRRDREMLQRWSESQVLLSPAEKGHATRLAKVAHQYANFYVIPFADESAAIGGISKDGPAHLLAKRVRSVAVAKGILRRTAEAGQG